MNEKQCSRCKKVKPLAEFHVRRASKDGRKSECAMCGRERQKAFAAANPEKVKASRDRHRRENPETVKRVARNSKLKAKFGITLEQYESMSEAQGGVCAICQGTPNGSGGFHVDHCHLTGKVRALLCSECNLGLGKFRDDPVLVQKALEYLRAHV